VATLRVNKENGFQPVPKMAGEGGKRKGERGNERKTVKGKGTQRDSK